MHDNDLTVPLAHPPAQSNTISFSDRLKMTALFLGHGLLFTMSALLFFCLGLTDKDGKSLEWTDYFELGGTSIVNGFLYHGGITQTGMAILNLIFGYKHDAENDSDLDEDQSEDEALKISGGLKYVITTVSVISAISFTTIAALFLPGAIKAHENQFKAWQNKALIISGYGIEFFLAFMPIYTLTFKALSVAAHPLYNVERLISYCKKKPLHALGSTLLGLFLSYVAFIFTLVATGSIQRAINDELLLPLKSFSLAHFLDNDNVAPITEIGFYGFLLSYMLESVYCMGQQVSELAANPCSKTSIRNLALNVLIVVASASSVASADSIIEEALSRVLSKQSIWSKVVDFIPSSTLAGLLVWSVAFPFNMTGINKKVNSAKDDFRKAVKRNQARLARGEEPIPLSYRQRFASTITVLRDQDLEVSEVDGGAAAIP